MIPGSPEEVKMVSRPAAEWSNCEEKVEVVKWSQCRLEMMSDTLD
jgi:hypothetical protein